MLCLDQINFMRYIYVIEQLCLCQDNNFMSVCPNPLVFIVWFSNQSEFYWSPPYFPIYIWPIFFFGPLEGWVPKKAGLDLQARV